MGQADPAGLLEYCRSLPHEVFLQGVEGFGLGSMRNALVHTADCYRFWLGERALDEKTPGRFGSGDCPDAAAASRLFDGVDSLVERFLARYGGGMEARVSLEVRWQETPLVVTPRWLFAHTVTHEFHHKGQVVSMARSQGLEPPETDLALPAL